VSTAVFSARRPCGESASGRARRGLAVAVIGVVAVCHPGAAIAQQPSTFEVGGQVVLGSSGEFDAAETGVGVRVSWHPAAPVGIEAEVTGYPGDFPGGRPFSRGRIEGLFGITAGPRTGRLRPFARIRPGFLHILDAPAPFPCLAIYPPPLSCSLASGPTLAVLDIGGGAEAFTSPHTFIRVDVGDRLVRYPGPALTSGRSVHADDFFSHDFRLAVGSGFRF